MNDELSISSHELEVSTIYHADASPVFSATQSEVTSCSSMAGIPAISFAEQLISLIPQAKVYAYVLCRDRTHAEDLVQTAFLNAYSKQDSFHAGTNMKAWFSTILRNAFYSEIRKSWRETQLGNLDSYVSFDGNQEARAELRDFIKRVLPHIPPKQAFAMLLIADDMGYEEVAEITSEPTGTMKSRVSRGRAFAKNLFEGAAVGNIQDIYDRQKAIQRMASKEAISEALIEKLLSVMSRVVAEPQHSASTRQKSLKTYET